MKSLPRTIHVLACLLILSSCQLQRQTARTRNFEYDRFKASLLPSPLIASDTMNFIEDNDFTAGADTATALFRAIDSVWRREKEELESKRPADKTEKKMIRADLEVVSNNIKKVSSYLNKGVKTNRSNCREKDCPLVAEVVKSRQIMYLYISGDLKDSFAVSTAIPSRETPNMNVRPTGPLFIKYT